MTKVYLLGLLNGVALHMWLRMSVEDWYGLEAWIEIVRRHWISLPWWVPVLVFLFFIGMAVDQIRIYAAYDRIKRDKDMN